MLLAVFGLVGIATPRVAEAARWQVDENCGPDHVLTQIWYDNDSDGFEFVDGFPRAAIGRTPRRGVCCDTT